jgi:hypothetical protein
MVPKEQDNYRLFSIEYFAIHTHTHTHVCVFLEHHRTGKGWEAKRGRKEGREGGRESWC